MTSQKGSLEMEMELGLRLELELELEPEPGPQLQLWERAWAPGLKLELLVVALRPGLGSLHGPGQKQKQKELRWSEWPH